MTTGIAEFLFGALVLAVFILLLVITVTFDDFIGDGRPKPAPRPERTRSTPRPGDRAKGGDEESASYAVLTEDC